MSSISDHAAHLREQNREQSGRFGEQEHTFEEVSLGADVPEQRVSVVEEFDKANSPWADAKRQYVSLKDTNKLIRGTLKENFPGVKFSVRGDPYAGGAATRVSWTEGPAEDAVEDALLKYVGSARDSLTGDYWDPVNSYEYDTDGTPIIRSYASDHVTCTREMTEETQQEARELVDTALRDEGIDPDERSFDLTIPQGMYDRMTVENGYRDEYGPAHARMRYGGHSIHTLRRIAESMIANEKAARTTP